MKWGGGGAKFKIALIAERTKHNGELMHVWNVNEITGRSGRKWEKRGEGLRVKSRWFNWKFLLFCKYWETFDVYEMRSEILSVWGLMWVEFWIFRWKLRLWDFFGFYFDFFCRKTLVLKLKWNEIFSFLV